MANLNFHPAPGLGDLLPGFFVVPQNPITSQGVGVTYVPGIGELLPGAFAVPQNPIRDYTSGQVKLIGQTSNGSGVSGCNCGCNGSGACGSGSGSGQLNGQRVNGMSGIAEDWATIQAEISAGNIQNVFTSPVFGIPLWAIGAALVGFMFIGGEKHSYAGRGRRAYRAAERAFF